MEGMCSIACRNYATKITIHNSKPKVKDEVRLRCFRCGKEKKIGKFERYVV